LGTRINEILDVSTSKTFRLAEKKRADTIPNQHDRRTVAHAMEKEICTFKKG
jgi:hypothetical protein